jgi:hypothetical protein
MSLTRQERETIINFNEEDDTCSIFSFSKPIQNKMNKLVSRFPNEFSVGEVLGQGIEYICNKKYVSIRPPRKVSESSIKHLKTVSENTRF